MLGTILPFLLLFSQTIGTIKPPPSGESPSNIHVIFSNHLDVGFDGISPTVGYAMNVINKYFVEYFPQAVSISNQIRQMPGRRYIWTTQPWLVSLYLNCSKIVDFLPIPPTGFNLSCPDNATLSEFLKVVQRGDITWHAFPFNAQLSFADAGMLGVGLDLVKQLDTALGLPMKMTLSQRDVPGITVGSLNVLNQHGIKAVSVGVNGGSAPPVVPKIFLWKEQNSGASVIGMWHAGGYGDIKQSDCVIITGFSDALAFAWRGDNSGPGDVNYVIDIFNQLEKEFPSANIFASTFDNFVAKLSPVASQLLPVVTSEIGDSWVYGIPSDPWKVQMWREISRVYKTHLSRLSEPVGPASEGLVANQQLFETLLIKAMEHTWGLDVKTFLHDTGNWSNYNFQKWRHQSNFLLMEASWDEQRGYIYKAIQSLASDPLANEILSALSAIKVTSSPDITKYTLISDWTPQTNFSCGSPSGAVNWNFRLSEAGGLSHLIVNNKVLADENHILGQYIYQTFNSSDFDDFTSKYSYCSPSTCGGWIKLDFGKPNVDVAQPLHGTWYGVTRSVYTYEDTSTCSFVQSLSIPPQLVNNYGAPQTIFIITNFSKTEKNVSMDYYVMNKTPTRLPEAHFIGFVPLLPELKGSWRIHKCDQWIDPLNTVVNGSMHLHAQLEGLRFVDSTGQIDFSISSLDVPIVSLGSANPFPTPFNSVGNPSDGLYFNFYNNLWGTNYIMWYPWRKEDASNLFRFRLGFA